MNPDSRLQSAHGLQPDCAQTDLILLIPGLQTALVDILHALDKPATPGEYDEIRNKLERIGKSLQFVGEASMAIFFRAMELLPEEQLQGGDHINIVQTAGHAMLGYLDELCEGGAPHPLRLFSVYKRLLAARGQEKIHPVDLVFFAHVDAVDLQVPLKTIARHEACDIAVSRTEFERVLLEYQQAAGTRMAAGHLQHMAELIGLVADAQSHRDKSDEGIGNFWRVLEVAVTVLASAGIEVDQYAKKFLGQINLQLRRLAGGAVDGDARLLREALFFIALAPVTNASASAFKSTNGLPDLQQSDYLKAHHVALGAERDATFSPAADNSGLSPNSNADLGTNLGVNLSVNLSELAKELARAEEFLEASFNGAHAPAEAARVLRELALTADRLKLDLPSRLLHADAVAVGKLSVADNVMRPDDVTIKNVIHNLAALSLSLPLMTHRDEMYYPGHFESAVVNLDAVAVIDPIITTVIDAAHDDSVAQTSATASDLTEPAAEQSSEEELDLELLDIFLMEAEEIIGNVDNTLQVSRSDPDNMAHVTVLRRGFHTLKGSSRMVGLHRLGEGAMAVEGFLNTWLTRAAPGSLLDYAVLDYARQEVAMWIAEIKEYGKSSRRPDALIAAVANAARETRDAEPEQSFSPPKLPAAEPQQQTIHVGSMIMPARLHQIYCDESRGLLEIILAQLQQWRRAPAAMIAPELLRATHSLKSSAASVQFDVLQAVAQSLDELMQFVENYPGLLDEDVCDVLLPLVLQLQGMQRMFAAAQMPPARDDLRQQLETLLNQLEERRGEMEEIDEAANAYADDIDPELLEIFLEEGRDLLPQIGESLHKLQKAPDDDALIRYVLRPLHTIKGSARMAGAMYLGQHMHELESRISEMVREGTPSAAQIDDLLARYDRGLQLFEALQPPGMLVATAEPTGETSRNPGAQASSDPVALADADPGKSLGNAPLVRIRAGILDSLLNQAGEISISRSGLESNVNVLRQHLADLSGNVARLSTQLREVEIQAEIQIAASNQRQPQNQYFDPLEFDRFTHLQELTRMLAESVNDVSSLQKNLLEAVDHTQNGLAQQARLTRDMQQELMRARMVQFRDVEERLHRLVRQMAKETGKEIALEIIGNTVELDRSILEKMVGPFEHLLRNAAAHGIEPIEQRRAAGKDAIGHLLLEVRQEGNEVMIRFSDDGQGLDLGRIHEKAVQLGLIDRAHHLSDAELSGIIFQPGFTTSTDVTAIAGRGVGMDVVRSEVASLGGRISIASEAGAGASFIIHLPLSLAVTQVVLLELGEQTYAIPSLLVEQVLQLKSAEQARVFSDGSLDWQGRKLPVHYLSALLGEDTGVPQQQALPVLVVKSGHDFLAILVDRIIGNREVVTKNIGPQLAYMVGVVGATVLGSGSIVLILNPIQLAQYQGYQKMLRRIDASVADQGSSRQTIMVVDDSLTVRRVMQRLLLREGYHVVLATDGVDALQQLRSMRPDIVLLDIEMPRMDGFDLARHIRDMPGTATLPIIMITSRTAAKHRERAMELGVNAYLGKPYQDEVLLKLIHGLIGGHDEGGASAFGIEEVLFTLAESAQPHAPSPPVLDK